MKRKDAAVVVGVPGRQIFCDGFVYAVLCYVVFAHSPARTEHETNSLAPLLVTGQDMALVVVVCWVSFLTRMVPASAPLPGFRVSLRAAASLYSPLCPPSSYLHANPTCLCLLVAASCSLFVCFGSAFGVSCAKHQKKKGIERQKPPTPCLLQAPCTSAR